MPTMKIIYNIRSSHKFVLDICLKWTTIWFEIWWIKERDYQFKKCHIISKFWHILSLTVHRQENGNSIETESIPTHKIVWTVWQCAYDCLLATKKELLKRLITGDEKWILYNNFQRKWTCIIISKGNEPERKNELNDALNYIYTLAVLVSIWWDY